MALPGNAIGPLCLLQPGWLVATPANDSQGIPNQREPASCAIECSQGWTGGRSDQCSKATRAVRESRSSRMRPMRASPQGDRYCMAANRAPRHRHCPRSAAMGGLPSSLKHWHEIPPKSTALNT